MLERLGSLVDTPWIFGLVGVSVLLDVFVPVLPSGVLLISAASAGTAGSNSGKDMMDIVELLLCTATASCLGDLAAYRLAYRGSSWLDRRLSHSHRLSTARERLGGTLLRGGGSLVILARFAPAGRSVVSLSAGAAHRRLTEFLPWSALAGLVWAAYGVGFGYVSGRWLGATWLTTVVSLVALFGAGAVAAHLFRLEEPDSVPAALGIPEQATGPAQTFSAEAG